MKRFIALLIIVFASKIMVAQSTPTKFINYAAVGFSVMLPDTLQYGKPDFRSDKIPIKGGDVNADSWTMFADGAIYSILIADYPAKVAASSEASAFLKEGKQGIINQLMGELVNEKPITINNNPGIRFQIKSDNGTVDAINLFVGTKLYTLFSLYNPATMQSKDADTFLSSFRLR